MTATRRLAAILAADVVGYSRLMSEDEAGTAQAVREHREAARPIVAGFGGRIVNTTGDGLLLEFPSVVAAVECAIAIQKLMADRNAGTPEARRIVYRIGVNLGDVLIDGDDILGEGVNIAARLEALCEPGGILISGAAYDHVRGRIDATFVDLGETALKNIAEPVRVTAISIGEEAYDSPLPPQKARVKLGAPAFLGIAALLALLAAAGWHGFTANRPAAVPAAVAPSAPVEAAHLSIVVLPFKNLSGDSGQDYFADGITENLTTELARVPDSFIIARNTAFTYKGRSVDAKEIGKELGVRYVLEGSAQRDGTRVRVNAQLVDAESGAHLWADRFEENIADLFKLQDHIVARLANSLKIALTSAEAEKGARSKDPDVIDLRLRGLNLLNVGFAKPPNAQREGFHEARASFERVLQIDPNDAVALAGRAYTYFFDYLYGWGDAGTDYDAEILALANRAINLAPDDPTAYGAKAFYLTMSGRHGEALGAADAGLAVNPNHPTLYQARALAENSLGRYEQAKADLERAMRISPRDPLVALWHDDLGDAEMGLGDFDSAIGEYRKALDMGSQAYYVHSDLAAAYAQAGRMDEARAELAEARRLNPAITVKWMQEHSPNIPSVFDGLRKAGLSEE
jgi:TolB-like protein/class 3 adenylate cyclase/Flp pilus assembly protein TadD